jgi:cystathionine beta-lyase
MSFDFDRVIDRRGTNSAKWSLHGEEVLPLWVADMDFASPEPVQEALRRSVEHGIFGYEFPTREIRETVADRMKRLYHWRVLPEMVLAVPGVIAGFSAAVRTTCKAGQGIVIQPPVYPPFLSVPANNALVRQDAPLRRITGVSTFRYEVDFDAFEQAVNSGNAKTGMFLFCHPHNPTGLVYPAAELARMAAICVRNQVVICSDEIHCEILLGGQKHIPIATLSPEIQDRTITLVAPSKTFNIPGLYCAFAIIPNPDLRAHFKTTIEQMAMHVNSLGLVAAQAAFSGKCDDWLAALRIYLTGNRDYLVEFIRKEMYGIKVTVPDATYLAWLDCNQLSHSGRITGTPQEHFLKQAKVFLSEGREFGPGGEGFVRLNFGCPRRTLIEALDRMKFSLM